MSRFPVLALVFHVSARMWLYSLGSLDAVAEISLDMLTTLRHDIARLEAGGNAA